MLNSQYKNGNDLRHSSCSFLYFDGYWIVTAPIEMCNVPDYEHRTNNTSEGMLYLLQHLLQFIDVEV